MGTLLVCLIIAAGVTIAVVVMVKDKKKGKYISCGGDCNKCVSTGCRNKEERDIENTESNTKSVDRDTNSSDE